MQIASATTSLGGSLAFSIPATILRMRGEIFAITDGAAESEALSMTLGIGVVSSDAFAAGAGSMPDPGGEPEYPWLYWTAFFIINQSGDTASTPGEQNQIGQAYRLRFDSKAMRKVKPGQSLTWVIQTDNATAADIFLGQTRVLIGT